jgi:hypothetical protein
MSHFSVLVITPEKLNEGQLKEIMMPFHEYECTGVERYLQDMDKTAEVEEYFNKPQTVVRRADGRVT